MPDIQLIYASTPFGYDIQRLNSILSVARRRNAAEGITGALVCRHDLFLQMLEGAASAVEAAFLRIKRDDRHVDVHRLWIKDCNERLFTQWEMLHDPARSWIWTPKEVEDGAVRKAAPEALLGIFSRIAADPQVGVQ